jgi:hypothetical protein
MSTTASTFDIGHRLSWGPRAGCSVAAFNKALLEGKVEVVPG